MNRPNPLNQVSRQYQSTRRGRGGRRGNRRQEQQIQAIKRDLYGDPTLMSPIIDPPMIKQSSLMSRTVRLAYMSIISITPAIICSAVFGTLTSNFGLKVQLDHTRVWCETSSSALLTVNVLLDPMVPLATASRIFSDRGTAGSQRPSVHFKHSMLVRKYWFDAENSSTLMTYTAPVTNPIIIDMHVRFEITPAVLTF